MQNQLLPEETPEYRTVAPKAQQTAAVAEATATARNTANAAEIQTEIIAAKRSGGRHVLAQIVGFYVAFIGPMILCLGAVGKPPALSWASAITGALASFFAGIGIIYLGSNQCRALRDYAHIVQTYGIDAVPLLIEWRKNGFSQANLKAIDAALTEALSLTDSDSDCFSGSGNGYFRRVLRENAERTGPNAGKTELCLAILAALKKVGEPSYLPIVEKLAARQGHDYDGVRLRSAAVDCLPILREREQIVALEQTLLPQIESAETSATLVNAEISAALQAQLRRVSRRHRIRPLIGGAAVCGVFALIRIYHEVLNQLDTPRAIYQSMWFFLALFTGSTCGATWWWLRGSRLKAKNLKRYGGLKTVGALIDMLATAYTGQDREALHATLIPLLTQMRPTDASRLNRRQRAILNRSLQSLTDGTRLLIYSETFDLAILKALEQVGDAGAMPVFEKLTRMEADTTAKIRIRHAAQECLPLLQIRAGLVAESKTLLRASAPESASHDTLLRAAADANDTPPDELLRPSDGRTPPR